MSVPNEPVDRTSISSLSINFAAAVIAENYLAGRDGDHITEYTNS
jgi:hypothetical protein